MKIIKSGEMVKSRRKDEEKMVTCKHCGAILKILPKDVQSKCSVIPQFYFECPCCKKLTKLSLKCMTPNFKYWVLYFNEEF